MLKVVYNGEMDPRQGKAVTGKVIPELLESDPKIVYLDADLMSCIGTLKLAKDNDRVIECGIAEANMVGVAAGLAAAGFKPICHSFGIFSSRRVFDQAFLSAGYAKNDITILGSDAGVSAALNGGTHMPFEDMALYSALPGATVIDVSDATCLDSVLRQCPDRRGVKYIRFSRKDYAKIYEEGSELPIGKAVTLREGSDVVIFACGLMLHEALKAAETLAKEEQMLTYTSLYIHLLDQFLWGLLQEKETKDGAETVLGILAQAYGIQPLKIEKKVSQGSMMETWQQLFLAVLQK